MAYQHRRMGFVLKFLGIDIQPHQEHEDDDAHLAQRVKKSQARRRKQIRRQLRCNPAQQRWPQQDAGKHFSDDAGLVKFSKQAAHQAAHGKNHRDLQNQSKEVRHR